MIISEENKKILLKRLESLIWKIVGIAGGLVLGFISQNIGLLNIPEIYQVIIGLIISEISKYYNVDVPKLQGLPPRIRIL